MQVLQDVAPSDRPGRNSGEIGEECRAKPACGPGMRYEKR
jgi:hypothetical protein